MGSIWPWLITPLSEIPRFTEWQISDRPLYNGEKRRRKFPFTPHTTLRLGLLVQAVSLIAVSFCMASD
jgi:hypothetical protein